MKNNDKIADEDRYEEGYKKAVNDIIYSILSYSPKSDDYREKCTMRRCRDEIARKINYISSGKTNIK